MKRIWFSLPAAAMLLAACNVTPVRPPEPAAPVEPPVPSLRYLPAQWQELPGWTADDLAAAWPALQASCRSPRMPQAWRPFCTQVLAVPASERAAQRTLLETRLRPWRLVLEGEGGRPARQDQGLITGYYEPVLNGSRRRGGSFQTPLYAVPDDLVIVDLGALYPALQGERVRGRLQGRRVTPYPDRAQLADGQLPGGKEIVWVDSAIDAFFLQIQGSGRVRLPDGTMIRVAFADVNGHPYRAIGRYLVAQGEMTVEEATAPAIRQWLAAHPDRQAEVFNTNPSVVFFREQPLGNPAVGPDGAMGVPLTAGRSLAVDPRLLPLGAPMFLASTHPVSGAPLQRLMLAQDTGGAIRGALRADFFWGMGAEAGDAAGRMRQDGALWLLWPVDQPLPVAAP
ncbi:MAG TPA: MltA domain-containing protein [Steroidobacteraceae bacterium]|nr:MltA domain-containing protein [Steroidobacteraceae bacterium]